MATGRPFPGILAACLHLWSCFLSFRESVGLSRCGNLASRPSPSPGSWGLPSLPLESFLLRWGCPSSGFWLHQREAEVPTQRKLLGPDSIATTQGTRSCTHALRRTKPTHRQVARLPLLPAAPGCLGTDLHGRKERKRGRWLDTQLSFSSSATGGPEVVLIYPPSCPSRRPQNPEWRPHSWFTLVLLGDLGCDSWLCR